MAVTSAACAVDTDAGRGPAVGAGGTGVPAADGTGGGGLMPGASSAGGGGGGGPDGGLSQVVDNIEECAGVRAEGNIERAPVDIVWVIDASGSMIDEQQRIQENLESFANTFTAAGINARVVIVTDDDIGSCTSLSGSPDYLYVEGDVDSSNSLVQLLDHYPRYAGHLRPDAVTHFIAVTDDESELDAASFRGQMEANLGGPFVLHAIASEDTGMAATGTFGFGGACMPAVCEDDPVGACGGAFGGFPGGFGGFPMMGTGGGPAGFDPFCGATRPGRVYYDLADQTGGEKISICADDWAEVFQRLETAVIATSALPCRFGMPAAPEGEVLDLARVRVDFTPAGAQAMSFPRADDAGACADHQAWYYDNPAAPSEIVLCPEACGAVETGGGIAIVLGCTPPMVVIQ